MVRWSLIGLAAALLAGCGAEPTLPVVPASGKVSFKGAPLVGATLIFAPESGNVISTATSDEQGQFEAITGEQIGALPGAYSVIVSKYETIPGRLIPGEHVATEGTSKLVTPAKYAAKETTDLKVSIPPEGSQALEVVIPE